jgi:exodeoxyribonuclease X
MIEQSRLIRVIDFETTGMPPDAAICEIGWADIGEGAYQGHQSVICNPGRPMPPEARAVHHLSDADCANGISVTEGLRVLMAGADVFCAHNVVFEQAFFAGGDRPWICTLKVARRLWPECPSHSNQCLRYWLGLNIADLLAMPPHRAGPDAYVTAEILRVALGEATVEQMIAWTKLPSLLPSVTFGKHRGTPWPDLPWDYLQWVAFKSDLDADTKFTARYYLENRGARG